MGAENSKYRSLIKDVYIVKDFLNGNRSHCRINLAIFYSKLTLHTALYFEIISSHFIILFSNIAL